MTKPNNKITPNNFVAHITLEGGQSFRFFQFNQTRFDYWLSYDYESAFCQAAKFFTLILIRLWTKSDVKITSENCFEVSGNMKVLLVKHKLEENSYLPHILTFKR